MMVVNLIWLTLGLLSYGTMALTFHLISIKDGYHGRHRIQQRVQLTATGAWDFGDAPTVSFHRGGRVPEWDGSACYVS